MLAETRGLSDGIEVTASKLLQKDCAPLRNIATKNPCLILTIMLVAGVTGKIARLPATGIGIIAEVPPAGGLSYDGLIHEIRARPPEGSCDCRGEGSIIEKMAMYSVGKAHPVFSIGGEILVEAAGAAGAISAGDIDVQGVGEWLGIVNDPGAIWRKSKFRIPWEHQVAGTSFPLSGCAPVVSIPVGISHKKIKEHVIDERVDIEILLDRGIL